MRLSGLKGKGASFHERANDFRCFGCFLLLISLFIANIIGILLFAILAGRGHPAAGGGRSGRSVPFKCCRRHWLGEGRLLAYANRLDIGGRQISNEGSRLDAGVQFFYWRSLGTRFLVNGFLFAVLTLKEARPAGHCRLAFTLVLLLDLLLLEYITHWRNYADHLHRQEGPGKRK